MKKIFYEANWHREFTRDNDTKDGETIDSTYIEGAMLTRVIKEAKKELQKLYDNKEEYNKWLNIHSADCIDINIDQYSFYTENSDVEPTFENRWEFDPQWEELAAIVYIDKNGKAKYKLL